jgi:hypothetical protein
METLKEELSMKKLKIWKRTVAGLLSLLIVAGFTPVCKNGLLSDNRTMLEAEAATLSGGVAFIGTLSVGDYLKSGSKLYGNDQKDSLTIKDESGNVIRYYAKQSNNPFQEDNTYGGQLPDELGTPATINYDVKVIEYNYNEFDGFYTVILQKCTIPNNTASTTTPVTTKDASNTTLGTHGIAFPSNSSGNSTWTGNYVYYGKYNGQPVKYRIAAPKTTAYGGTTMLLDCDSFLYTGWFDDNSYEKEWPNCDLRTKLNGGSFLNKNGVFTAIEKAAIAQSYRTGRDVSLYIPGNKKNYLIPQSSYLNRSQL